MFNEQDYVEYKQDFIQIGVLNKDEQKTVLDFFYNLGVILINKILI